MLANHIRRMEFKERHDWIPGCTRMVLAGVRQISWANPHAFWLLCASVHTIACSISLKDAHCGEISHYGLTWVNRMGPMTVSQASLCQMPMRRWDTHCYESMWALVTMDDLGKDKECVITSCLVWQFKYCECIKNSCFCLNMYFFHPIIYHPGRYTVKKNDYDFNHKRLFKCYCKNLLTG